MMGRWTGKRWSRALQHARGQSNKRAAVKNQYLLINFPTLLACKKPAEQCLYWHSSPPKPKALTGRDAIRVESWTGARLEKKGHRVLAAPAGSHVGLGAGALEWLPFFLGGALSEWLM